MEAKHIRHQISDYVIGLLTPDERRALEIHAATCLDCQVALQRERQVALLVRETLQAAPQPTAERLRSLMPPVERRPPARWVTRGWQRQLAPLMVALLLLLSTFGLRAATTQGWFQVAPGAAVETATPTATLAQTATESPSPTVGHTAVATQSPAPNLVRYHPDQPAPAPIRTPLAGTLSAPAH